MCKYFSWNLHTSTLLIMILGGSISPNHAIEETFNLKKARSSCDDNNSTEGPNKRIKIDPEITNSFPQIQLTSAQSQPTLTTNTNFLNNHLPNQNFYNPQLAFPYTYSPYIYNPYYYPHYNFQPFSTTPNLVNTNRQIPYDKDHQIQLPGNLHGKVKGNKRTKPQNKKYKEKEIINTNNHKVELSDKQKNARNPILISDLYKKLDINDWSNEDCMIPNKKHFRTDSGGFLLKTTDINVDLCKILKDIVKEDITMDSYIVTDSEINIGKSYIESKKHELDTYLEAKKYVIPEIYNNNYLLYKKECYDLLVKIISLRLIKEIVDNKTIFPQKTYDSKKCKEDFISLCNKSEISIDDKLGMSASDCIMQNHRLDTGKTKNSFKKSPNEMFQNIDMVSRLATELKRKFINKDLTIKNVTVGFNNDCIRYKTTCSDGAFQFRPSYVKYVLNLLKSKHNITIHKICDWCTGWGDRLLGALASVNDLGISQYIGTDPNTSLHSAYMEICSTYVPENYQIDNNKTASNDNFINIEYNNKNFKNKILKICIFKKPVEDLNNQEIHPGESDLMLTSIPYFNKELYKGTEQSHVRYPYYSNSTDSTTTWIDGFLKPFIVQSVTSIKDGGCIAINAGNINMKKKTTINNDGIDIGEHKIYDDLKNILQGYNDNGTTLSYLCEIPYSTNGIASSNTIIYKVNRFNNTDKTPFS